MALRRWPGVHARGAALLWRFRQNAGASNSVPTPCNRPRVFCACTINEFHPRCCPQAFASAVATLTPVPFDDISIPAIESSADGLLITVELRTADQAHADAVGRSLATRGGARARGGRTDGQGEVT